MDATDRDFRLPHRLDVPSKPQQKSIQFDTAFDFDSTFDRKPEGLWQGIRVTVLRGMAIPGIPGDGVIVSGPIRAEQPFTT